MVFNEDGTFFGYHDDAIPDQTLPKGPMSDAGYERHLRYLDVLVGRVLQTLREKGQLDESLIIMTADHGFHDGQQQRNVPLIVKLPGQQDRKNIASSLRNDQLGPIIDAAMRGETDPSLFVELIHTVAKQPTQNESIGAELKPKLKPKPLVAAATASQ